MASVQVTLAAPTRNTDVGPAAPFRLRHPDTRGSPVNPSTLQPQVSCPAGSLQGAKPAAAAQAAAAQRGSTTAREWVVQRVANQLPRSCTLTPLPSCCCCCQRSPAACNQAAPIQARLAAALASPCCTDGGCTARSNTYGAASAAPSRAPAGSQLEGQALVGHHIVHAAQQEKQGQA